MSENKSSLKVLVQKIGTALSSMVMPNIGAFIAWGLITARINAKSETNEWKSSTRICR